MPRLREYWGRFWALPWSRKGPALAVAVLAPLVAVGLGLGLTLGRSGEGDKPEATPTPSVTSTGTPTSTPRPTQTATSTTAPPPTATPEPPPQREPGASNGSRPTEGGYRLVGAVRTAGFDRMLGLVMIPGSPDQAVVVTQGGMIWRVSLSDAFQPRQFGDLRGRLIANAGNEEGLLGLAFSPNFSFDGRVYVYYTAGNPRRSVLSRFQVSGGSMNMGSERLLLEVPQPFSNHNGGQLAFGPDGYLYVAVGDGGSAGDPQGNGQNPGTLLGSILRVDVSGDGYRVPSDNPFAGRDGARGEVYAYGLRNPWRFSFDRATGALWAGDVGQDAWEEVDRIVAGGNYGWNIFEGFACFAGHCDTGGLRPPRAVYGHSFGCSITGGYVYRGPSMPELNGWYVYGDFCSGRIWAVNTEGQGDAVLLANTGLPVSSWAELPNGELLAVTFANQIFRLERAP